MLSTILFIIRTLTPKIGSDSIPPASEDKNWKKITNTIKRNGYELTNIPFPIKLMYYFLTKLPMELGEPVINPIVNAKYTVLDYGDRIPVDVIIEKSLDHLFLKSYGSYFLKPSDREEYKWVVDFTDLEEYDVDPKLYKYGCKAYFSEDSLRLIVLDDVECPPSNEIAILRFKATTAFKIIVEVHACCIHLSTAQNKVIKYSGNTDYPEITDLIHLMTYDVLRGNVRLPILIDEKGLVNRIFGLTTESYTKIMGKFLKRGPYTREEILGTEGTEWNKKIKNYYLSVTDLFNKMEVNEEIKDELIDLFVVSSAMHNNFGDVSTYNLAVDGFLLPKVYISNPGLLSRIDVDVLNTMLVGISLRYPTLGEEVLTNAFSNDNQRKIWKSWADSLKEDDWFYPLLFETSVSF